MGLLDFFSGKKQVNIPDGDEPSLTEEDKKWVESCFRWLAKNFSGPVNTIYLFNAEYFGKTFSEKEITIDNLLDDLCGLLKVERTLVSYQHIPDVRNISQTPHEIQGKVFESDIEVNTINPEKPKYNIHLADDLSNEYIILRRLVIELVRIKLNEAKKDSIYNPQDIYIAYMASVYFGFGVLISKMSSERVIDYTAGWQRTWTAKTEVRYPVIAFALAAYCNLTKSDYESWETELPLYVKKEFEASLRTLEKSPLDLTSKEKPPQELSEFEIHRKAAKEFYDNKNYQAAIPEYIKAIELTQDAKQLTILNNNVGYSYILLAEYEQSIPYFEKTLQETNNYPYAVNNLGFVYLMLGQPDKAKTYFDKLEITDNLIKAYRFRNMAIYYMKKNELQKAGEYFMKAFEVNVTIDLLEFFYATYLYAISEDEEAMQYLTISVNKEEKEGMELMKQKKQ